VRRLEVFGAGSLRGALPEIAAALRESTGLPVELRLGPSGLLREEIEDGRTPDLFLSADMSQPETLWDKGLAEKPAIFARNELCLLADEEFGITPANLVERLLDPEVRLGTSTPGLDPGGDYAYEVLKRADALQPGSSAALMRKAVQAVGGRASLQDGGAARRHPVARAFEEGTVNAFLGYRTSALQVRSERPGLALVPLPPPLVVQAAYAMVVLRGAAPAAHTLAEWILSPEGRQRLVTHGFLPP